MSSETRIHLIIPVPALGVINVTLVDAIRVLYGWVTFANIPIEEINLDSLFIKHVDLKLSVLQANDTIGMQAYLDEILSYRSINSYLSCLPRELLTRVCNVCLLDYAIALTQNPSPPPQLRIPHIATAPSPMVHIWHERSCMVCVIAVIFLICLLFCSTKGMVTF